MWKLTSVSTSLHTTTPIEYNDKPPINPEKNPKEERALYRETPNIGIIFKHWQEKVIPNQLMPPPKPVMRHTITSWIFLMI